MPRGSKLIEFRPAGWQEGAASMTYLGKMIARNINSLRVNLKPCLKTLDESDLTAITTSLGDFISSIDRERDKRKKRL